MKHKTINQSEGRNGVNVSRRKRLFFYRQPSKMQTNLNRQKFLTISNVSISASLHGLLAPEAESLN